MNKRTVLIYIAICLVSAALVKAQTKQISSRAFYEANAAAQKLLSERSSRMITKTDNIENGTIVKSVTKIYERLLPDRERFLTTEKNGDRETRSEYIRIGYMEYRRENDEPWTVKDLRQSGGGSGFGNGSGNACIQYTEENTVVDGAPARKLRQYTVLYTPDGLSFDDVASWYDQSGGLLLKSERTKGLLEPRVEKTQSVTTYEYDSNIKIEAPKTAEPEKK